MLDKNVYAKIEECRGTVCIGEERYTFYRAFVSGSLMTVYVSDIYDPLPKGSVIYSNHYFITNDRTVAKRNMIALRMEDIALLNDDQYEDYCNVGVCVSGILLLPKHKYVSEVGKNKTPFTPCTLKMTNEDGDRFWVLLVTFDNNAKYVRNLRDGLTVNVKARIKKNRMFDSFELNVTSIDVVKQN